MTLVQKLTAKGFKSFAKRTELIFGNKFNIVLGPNGSGKSNIVDALCFVLGKSSAKDMRAEKSANLIYNGGKKGDPSKEAEVSIEFDNSKKIFPINTDSVRITRTVKQSGQSTYRLNDETITRQQILDVLNAANIDPDGHNIILQGDIIRIMDMRPVERREIIDSISGISVFEEKKIKCLNELEKAEEKLKEAEIILTEREANLRELKKERDQAAKYKEVQENIKSHKATYIHIQLKQKNEKIEELDKKIKENQSEITKVQEVIDATKAEINSTKDEIKNITIEIEDKGEKEQLVLRKEIEELKTLIIKSVTRNDVCKSEINKIEARKLQLQNNIKELESKIKEFYNSKQKLAKDKIDLEKELALLEEKIKKTKQKYGIADFKDIEDLDKEIEAQINSIMSLQSQKQEVISKKEGINFKINSLEEKISSLKGSKKEIEELKDKKAKLKKLSDDFSSLTAKDNSTASELSGLRKDLFSKTESLTRLQARDQAISERTFGDAAVKRILNLKNKINGIHGTVSELGVVKSKHALALEVAAGSRINSVVVDTDQTAAKCIQELKSQKIGIATFLPINKIKPRTSPAGIQTLLKKEGVEGLALDLVEYDKKFKDVFSYVFGSTLIVNSIETARKIGIGNVRMVTLEGDLMDVSGAMVGGYRQQGRIGGFKEEDLTKEISNLDKEIFSLRSLVKNLEKEKIEHENKLTELNNNKNSLEGDIIRIEKSLNLNVDISKLTSEHKDSLNNISSLEKEISEMNNKISLKNKEIEKLKQNKSKAREKLQNKELTEEISNLDNNKISLMEKVSNLNSEINSAETQINTILRPEIARTEKIIKDHEKETLDFSKESSDLSLMIKNRDKELRDKEDAEKKSYGRFKNLAQKRNSLNEKIQSKETNLVRHEEKIRSFEQKINGVSIERAKFVAEKEGLDKEFEEYKETPLKKGMVIDELKLKVREYEQFLAKMGNVNLRALEVYEEIAKEHGILVEKVTKLKLEKQDVLDMMAEIESNKKETFMKTYNVIYKNFRQIFSTLSTKGEAHFDLENPENPFEGGLDIKVKIIGNKYLDIKSLSGGEKTLAALAFIFAIQEHQPSPFYFLDEVDAALDKRNSEILSKLIAKYAEKAQYIVISHNDNIITEADQVYGVSMQDGISKIVSLKI